MTKITMTMTMITMITQVRPMITMIKMITMTMTMITMITQVRPMCQRTDVLQLQPVPGLLVPDVHLLGRQGVHLVMRMRGGRSSNTDYLAIMVTMTTTNLIIMTTAIMATMTIVDCVTLAIMVTLMKNTSSKSCIKDNFAEIQLWQPNVQECIIYHREYILHVL